VFIRFIKWLVATKKIVSWRQPLTSQRRNSIEVWYVDDQGLTGKFFVPVKDLKEIHKALAIEPEDVPRELLVRDFKDETLQMLRRWALEFKMQ
jgi:hypothetical protein